MRCRAPYMPDSPQGSLTTSGSDGQCELASLTDFFLVSFFFFAVKVGVAFLIL